jgi:hypothetical protein
MASKNRDKVLKIFAQHPETALGGREVARLGVFQGTGAWGGISDLCEEGLIARVGGKGTREDPYRYKLVNHTPAPTQPQKGTMAALHHALGLTSTPPVAAKPESDARKAVKWVLDGINLGVITAEDALKRIRQIVG